MTLFSPLLSADPILPSNPGLEDPEPDEDPLEELEDPEELELDEEPEDLEESEPDEDLEESDEDLEEPEAPCLPLLYPAPNSLPTALVPLTASPPRYPAPRTSFLPVFLTAVFTFSNLSLLTFVSCPYVTFASFNSAEEISNDSRRVFSTSPRLYPSSRHS